MATNLTNFLVSLVDDPQKLDTLKRDPDVVLGAADLTPKLMADLKLSVDYPGVTV